MTWAPLQEREGLKIGTDYWLAPEGLEITPGVNSVLLTRSAMDRILNELQFEREKRQAAERALVTAQQMIETRESLQVLVDEQRKDRWWQIGLAIGGGFAAGFATNEAANGDTVVVRR